MRKKKMGGVIMRLKSIFYGEAIANFLIAEGTRKTLSGNYHISFDEVNERFGTSLPDDEDLLESIVMFCIDSEAIAEMDTTEDFDLMFYLDYCPNAEC